MGTRSLTARGTLGAVSRRHPDDVDRITDARRELAAAKIADYIERVVDAAPELTQSQKDSLAVLLRGGAAA